MVCFLLLTSCGYTQQEKEKHTPLADPKLVLGHNLFFERRLSATGTKSCSVCHNPNLAFTDGYRRPPGIFGDLHHRNTPGLLNLRGQHYFNRADPGITSIAQQMYGPLFGRTPIEMGMSIDDTEVLTILSRDKKYSKLFEYAFGKDSEQVSWENIISALECYILSLSSFNSPYDAFVAGDRTAISASAISGEALFFSEKYSCGVCHKPPLFGAGPGMGYEEQFANIGLYNLSGGNYPSKDQGLFSVTQKETDKGRFKIPSLRNLAFTAPYFHDGSAETLEDVLDVYASGGRDISYGKWKGDGRENPHKHPLIKKLEMTREERYQLLDFLYCLTDSSILSNTHFLSPPGDSEL